MVKIQFYQSLKAYLISARFFDNIINVKSVLKVNVVQQNKTRKMPLIKRLSKCFRALKKKYV